MALSALNRASKVCIDRALCTRLTGICIADPVASESRHIYRGPRHWNRTNLRAHPGKQVFIEDQCHERHPSGNRPSHTGMCAVHHKVLGKPKLSVHHLFLWSWGDSHFYRVLPREECSLRDNVQGRQLQLQVRQAGARALRSTNSRHPVWHQTNLRRS